MIGLKIKRRWLRNCICSQRVFLFTPFSCIQFLSSFSLVLYLSLYLHLITLYLFSRYFYTRPVGRGIIFDLLFFVLSLHRFLGWKSGVLWHVDTKDPRSRLRVTPGMVSDVCHGFLAGSSVYFELFFLLALSSWAWWYPLVSIISFGRLVIAPSVSG